MICFKDTLMKVLKQSLKQFLKRIKLKKIVVEILCAQFFSQNFFRFICFWHVFNDCFNEKFKVCIKES